MTEDSMPLAGNISPPDANGEIIFDFPWQSRAFGVARALCENGLYEWDDFREELIAEIAKWNPDEEFRYFDYFQKALATLLNRKGFCEEAELQKKEQQFSARPHDHDHNHNH